MPWIPPVTPSLSPAPAGFPQVPAGLLATPGEAGAPQPVLVSPQAAAPGPRQRRRVTLSTRQASLQPVRVRVAGVIASTPALPAGGAFVIMPLAAIKSASHAAGADPSQ